MDEPALRPLNNETMQDWLQACIENFGHAPRDFGLWDRLTYLRLPKPLWLFIPPRDDLNTLFRNQDALFRDGIIVWGWTIQANYRLWEKGNASLPGEIVYSLDALDGLDHLYLEQLKYELSRLKGRKPLNPKLLQIAEYLTDETVRVFGLAVPSSMSSRLSCRISTTLFTRKHLPQRTLYAPFLPVLVNPIEPHVVIPLPERYWPDDLVQWWLNSGFPFVQALEEFSDHEEVRHLEKACRRDESALSSHMDGEELDAAEHHRDLKVKHGHQLTLLLEQLWNNRHG